MIGSIAVGRVPRIRIIEIPEGRLANRQYITIGIVPRNRVTGIQGDWLQSIGSMAFERVEQSREATGPDDISSCWMQ